VLAHNFLILIGLKAKLRASLRGVWEVEVSAIAGQKAMTTPPLNPGLFFRELIEVLTNHLIEMLEELRL
jgi:hypothetical protein